MTDTRAQAIHMTGQRKQAVIEGLWLSYYNDTLYEKGVITETERNKMRVKIKNRAACAERSSPCG